MTVRNFREFFSFCFVIFAVSTTFARAQESEIDVPKLIREAKQKSDENSRKAIVNYPNYTYKWRKIWRGADKKGNTEERSELAEIFAPPRCAAKKCRTVFILLEENGKPVSAEKIAKERARAGEKLEKLENVKQKQPVSLKPDFPLNWMRFAYFVGRSLEDEPNIIVRIDGQEILEKCEFFAPARENIDGREMISLKFRPRSDAVFARETNYSSNSEGKIWIDAADKVFVRLLMWQKGTKFEKETGDYLLERAAVVYDMTRTKEGIWFMRLGQFRGLKNPALFAGMKDDFSIENFEWHFFNTEIKEVELNKPL